MKKLLLLASALTGFAVVAQAQEATTVKTTTVQYQVPTCTNCRTTTRVTTTYPEPEPVCDTCAEPVVAQPVVAQPVKMKRKEKKSIICHDNHDLGIRNPLFVLKEGQFSAQEVAGVYREPKRKTHDARYASGKTDRIENRGWDAHMTLAYGITDRWTISAFGGKDYHIPKTKQYRAAMLEHYGDDHAEPIPHESGYDANIETNYHVLDLCHLDVIAGLRATWYRNKNKAGEVVTRTTGWGWAPTVTVGSNWGWFTPYVTAAYEWSHTHEYRDTNNFSGGKHWVDDDGYYVNPGIYIQPSKWYAFDFNVQKQEGKDAFWHLGVDFYPYKNVVVGIQTNARRPFRHPMHMQGLSGVIKAVF